RANARAYFPRVPPRKSYSGRTSSVGGLDFFFIRRAFLSSGQSSTDDADGLVVLRGMGDDDESSRVSHAQQDERTSSRPEWSGSGIVIDSGSPNAVAASAKETRCFRRLAAAFRRSHSNRIRQDPSAQRIGAKRRAQQASPQGERLRPSASAACWAALSS